VTSANTPSETEGLLPQCAAERPTAWVGIATTERLECDAQLLPLSADCDVRKPHENPAIDVLLPASRDGEVVEYALSRALSPPRLIGGTGSCSSTPPGECRGPSSRCACQFEMARSGAVLPVSPHATLLDGRLEKGSFPKAAGQRNAQVLLLDAEPYLGEAAVAVPHSCSALVFSGKARGPHDGSPALHLLLDRASEAGRRALHSLHAEGL
jgi:hypothetical protein